MAGDNIQVPSADELLRTALCSPAMNANKAINLPGEVKRVVLYAVSVDDKIDATGRETLRAAIEHVPGVLASMFVCSVPTPDVAPYKKVLHVSASMRPD